ncbi:MAG: DUF4832 domain-containing protein [Phycisphaerae bacterium]|nr:DUF4832 domain-containing protein [Phycisphaerae bacterium]
MEFNYLPMNSVVIGKGQYNWEPLENLLNDIASRGCQTIFRFYLEYPGKPTGIPGYLLNEGLHVHEYTNTNTQPFPHRPVITPDYQDRNLRAAMTAFIAEMGKKYDGDPRIGFITAGLLGTWGEWHTHPRNELWATREVQIEIMDAYEKAFRNTFVLLRYPAGNNDLSYAPTFQRRMGYHDDSFGWATLNTGRKGDEWFFLTRMATGGPAGLEVWKRFPIGGEIRPELWGCLWNENGCTPRGQDFAECIRQTHASWLMDSSTSRNLNEDQRRRAEAAAASLGYELHVSKYSARIQSGRLQTLSVTVENRGVAPFYYPWTVQVGILDSTGNAIQSWDTDWKLPSILPDHSARFEFRPPTEYSAQQGILAIRVVNPMSGGVPLRFANTNQDRHASGWLTLVTLKEDSSAR